MDAREDRRKVGDDLGKFCGSGKFLSENSRPGKLCPGKSDPEPRKESTVSLWEPGKIEGITPEIILNTCVTAYRDHVGMESPVPGFEAEHAADPPAKTLSPLDMPINEIGTVEGDQAFDRVSFAKWNKEKFIDPANGVEFEVADYFGSGDKPWRVQEPGWTSEEPEEGVGPSKLFTEAEIAAWLTEQNGPHPDPYVARIELTYNEKGHRAGYGIRKSGKCELWYN